MTERADLVMDFNATEANATATTATVDPLHGDYTGLAIVFVAVWGQVRGGTF